MCVVKVLTLKRDLNLILGKGGLGLLADALEPSFGNDIVWTEVLMLSEQALSIRAFNSALITFGVAKQEFLILLIFELGENFMSSLTVKELSFVPSC